MSLTTKTFLVDQRSFNYCAELQLVDVKVLYLTHGENNGIRVIVYRL